MARDDNACHAGMRAAVLEDKRRECLWAGSMTFTGRSNSPERRAPSPTEGLERAFGLVWGAAPAEKRCTDSVAARSRKEVANWA
jgi:hypothetical protein